jgi:S-adenosylmethionine uptake transporter
MLGILFWDDLPDAIAWGGMAMIIASGLLSIWRTYSEDRVMKGQTLTVMQASGSGATNVTNEQEPRNV